MLIVQTVDCPSDFRPEIEHLMHAGAPYLLRNCYVCWLFGGETDTEIYCSYPSLTLKKFTERENNWLSDFDEDAIEVSEFKEKSD